MRISNTTRHIAGAKPQRITNWSEYNDSLGRRATLPVELLRIQAPAWRSCVETGDRGRPEVYSRGWIECIALVRQAFKLPYRQTVALVGSLLPGRSGTQVPSWGHLACRVRLLGRTARFQRTVITFKQALADAAVSGKPVILLVDSTGLSIRGPNAWRVSKPGAKERPVRSFQRVHVAVDAATQQVLAVDITSPRVGDPTVLPGLLGAITDTQDLWIQSLAADGAYDTRGVYTACEAHGINDVRIPPKEGARRWKPGTPGANLRNGNLNMGTRTRDFIPGKAAWKVQKQYHVRSLVETAMSRLVSVTNQRLRNRSEDGQIYETITAVTLMNHHLKLGRPQRQSRAYTLPIKPPT